MRIVYVLRRSREWAEGKRSGPYWLPIEPYVEIWNRLFKTTYADFRAEMSAIRESGVDLSQYDAVVEQWQHEFLDEAAKPGTILVGCDEDDWIDPDAPNVLRKLGKVDLPIRWDFVMYSGAWTVRMQPPFAEKTNGLEYMSCNYALPTPLTDLSIIHDHSHANRMLLGGPEIVLPLALSVQNRTPASASHLRSRLTVAGDDLMDVMMEWVGDTVHQGNDLPEFARPLMAKVKAACQRAIGGPGLIPMA